MRHRITEAVMIERAWRELDKVWDKGSCCADCEFLTGFEGSWDEPPYSECRVAEAGEDPFLCPCVSRKDVKETLEAEAEEHDEE